MVTLKRNYFFTSLLMMGLISFSLPYAVLESCEFTSADSKTFYIGEKSYFSVTAPGASAMEQLGDTLPDQVVFGHDHKYYYLYGYPKQGTEGIYDLVFKAYSTAAKVDSCATQNFTLTVIERAQPPEVVSAEQEQPYTSLTVKAKNQKSVRYKDIVKFKPPKKGPTPVVFRVYKDKKLEHLAGEVPNTGKRRYRFVRRNVKACSTFHYYLVSVGENGIESKAVKASLNNSKENCPKKINRKKGCQ